MVEGTKQNHGVEILKRTWWKWIGEGFLTNNILIMADYATSTSKSLRDPNISTWLLTVFCLLRRTRGENISWVSKKLSLIYIENSIVSSDYMVSQVELNKIMFNNIEKKLPKSLWHSCPRMPIFLVYSSCKIKIG